MRRFFKELKRRKVYRVAAVYAAVAFVVVEAADLVFPALNIPSWAYSLVVVLALLGFPLALVLAWAFDLTPEGVERTPTVEAEEEQEAERPSRSSLPLAAKGLVALGLLSGAAAGGWYLLGSGGEPETESGPAERSIAVLPFENMGGEESEQFTHGVHDGLLTRLSNVSDLQVISRTSVMQYQGTDKTIPEIARELGAQWIVEGAVQQAGGQVQVNAQLIQAEADAHQWAQSYRRELTPENLFAIQSELTKEIAGSLKAELTPEEAERVERRPTEDLEAYQLYVQGRRELARGNAGDAEKAVRLFRRAIERDSSFALGWSGLADAAWGYEGYDTLGIDPAKAASRALESAPNLAEAHASVGLVHYRQRNGPAALQELQQAVSLKPSYSEAHNWLGLTYHVLGRPEQALEHLQLAEELDPENILARHFLYDTYVMMGQAEMALPEIREQQRRYPAVVGPYVAETRALYALGRYREAQNVAREHMQGARWQIPYLAGIETAMGDTTRARERLDELQRTDADPLVKAYAHAALGNVDATIEAMRKVEEWSYVPTFTVRYMTFPEGMSRIRDHPGYGDLIREINLFWGLNPDGSLPDSVDVEFEPDG